MDAQGAGASHFPFPVDPDDVPLEAVTAVRRTLLRQQNIDPGDPADGDDLARLIVAVVIAALREDHQQVTVQDLPTALFGFPVEFLVSGRNDTREHEMAKPAAVKHAHDTPTGSQLKYAESLAIKAGYPRAYAVTAARRDMRGKSPIGNMKRGECSELIDFLKARIGS